MLLFGVLAPSSHNTQPWRFHIDETEKSISIFADFSRRLLQSDSSGRMLFIALGCAAENIIIAAGHYGMDARVEYNSALASGLPEFALKIFLRDGGTGSISEELFKAIPRRASYRAAYQKKEVAREYIEHFVADAKEKEVALHAITDTKQKDLLAQIGGEGMKNCMHNRAFRWELAHWLRSNLTRASDGMPGEGHEMPLPISFLAPFILRFIDVSDVEQKKAIRRINNFPVVGILSTQEDDVLSWIKTGLALQRVLLDITASNMAASIMVAAIEDASAREKLTKFLRNGVEGTQGQLYPQIFFGFGYPTKSSPHSPRRSIKNVLK